MLTANTRPQPARPVQLILEGFRGVNVSDPPATLPAGVGRSCKNLYFENGMLYPRKGLERIGPDTPTVTSHRGFGAFNLSQGNATAPYVFESYVQAGVEKIVNRHAVPFVPLASGVTLSDGEANFFLYGNTALYGNAYTLLYFVTDLATAGGDWRKTALTPPAAPTLADGGAGGLTGTYTYYLAWKDPENGALSNPSVSASITVTAKQVDLTLPSGGGTYGDYPIHVYRSGGANTAIRFVAEVAAGVTAYTDNVADTALTDELQTNRDPFPAVCFADVYRNRLIGAYNRADNELDMLYISYEGEYWRCPLVTDIANSLDGARLQVSSAVDSRISAIKTFGDYVAVWTRSECHFLSGDDPQTFRLTKAWDIGCTSHRTAQAVDGKLVWLATKGVYLWDGSGHPVEVSGPIRERVKAWSNYRTTAFAFTWNGRYYLFCDGECWFLDLRASSEGVWAWGQITGWNFAGASHTPEDGTDVEVVYALENDATPYAYVVGYNYDDDGTKITVEWQSANLPTGQMMELRGNYRFFLARRAGVLTEARESGYTTLPVASATDLTVKVYADNTTTAKDTQTADQSLTTGEDLIEWEGDVSPDAQGRFLRFQVSGDAYQGDTAQRMYPIIENVQAWIVPLR
jgi:hypothetical protein